MVTEGGRESVQTGREEGGRRKGEERKGERGIYMYIKARLKT